MAEGNAAVNDQTRDLTLSILNEVKNLFGQFFGLLISIIGFAAMNTSKGKSLIDINPIMMMVFVFMVDLFYFTLVFVTMFRLQIKSFLDLFVMIILLLGTLVSFFALMIISPAIAWSHLGLWFLMFGLICYKNRKELYQMILEMIKNVIEYKTQSRNSEIPADGNFRPRENLNV